MNIGIDLGTTFSAVAYVSENGNAQIVTNRDGERTTPSVVMFEDGAIVVGEQAKENSVINPLDVCQFVKRSMGDKSFSFDVSITDSYSAEDISAMILKRLKEDAEQATGENITGAVITVPAYFFDEQRKATQDAGEIAGLNVLGIINEPTAAAIAYCHGQANQEGKVLVYDLGGGTFDVTIMDIANDFSDVKILATSGDRMLGGFNFDNEIMNKVIEDFENQYGIDLSDDDEALQELRLKSENLNKALSTRPKASFIISSEGEKMKVEMTRDEFDELTKSLVDSTKIRMEMAMDDAGLKWSDLTKVLLVGGSTRIPAIREMIEKLTGIAPSCELNPDEAVAIGAAYYANSLTNEGSVNVKVIDVNSHSLGIVASGMNDIILERNTPLPARKSKIFYTSCDNQTELLTQVVEGEDPELEYDTIVGECLLEIKPHPKGSEVEVEMSYDKNGMIHVSVRDLSDNCNLGEMEVERKSNLTKEEVKQKKDKLNKLIID